MCIWESLDKILYDWIWSCVRFAVRTNLKRFAICWSMQTVVCKAVIAYWSGRFVLHLVSRRYQQAVVKPRHNAYVLKSKFVLFLFRLNLVGIKKKPRKTAYNTYHSIYILLQRQQEKNEEKKCTYDTIYLRCAVSHEAMKKKANLIELITFPTSSNGRLYK